MHLNAVYLPGMLQLRCAGVYLTFYLLLCFWTFFCAHASYVQCTDSHFCVNTLILSGVCILQGADYLLITSGCLFIYIKECAFASLIATVSKRRILLFLI